MRPLYLSLKGLGPYLKAEIREEDFKLIHERRLFLITGEIGAGKTTLFDALLYALYGETSFPERSLKELLSHYLERLPKPFQPEVEFKFFFRGHIYHLTRRPAYKNFQEKTALWIDGTLYSSNKREIIGKVKELFGLEAEQFKKIFLIPQGEYRKVLLSKPAERLQLFEKLFETEFFSSLEKFFTDKTKEIRANLESLCQIEKECLKSTEVNSFEELENKIQELKENVEKEEREVKVLEKVLSQLDEKIKNKEKIFEALKRYFDLKERLSELDSQKDRIEKLKKQREKLKALKEKIYFIEGMQELIKRLKILKKEEKELTEELVKKGKLLEIKEREFKTLQEKEKEIEEKKRLLSERERAYKELVKIKEIEKTFKEREERLKNCEELLKKIEETEKKRETLLENLTKEYEELRKYQELKKEEELIFNQKAKLELLREKENLKEALIKELENLEKEKALKEKKLEEWKRKYLAVELAITLKEGEPCPVCGSKTHPRKAQKDLFLEKELANLERELENLNKHIKSKNEKLHYIKGKIDLLKREVGDLEEEALLQRLKAIEEALKIFQEKHFKFKDLSSYEKALKEVKEEFTKISEKKKRLEREYFELTKEVSSLKSELTVFKDMLKFSEDERMLEREISLLRKEISEFERKRSELEREIKELEKDKASKLAKKEALQREYKQRILEYQKNLAEVLSLINDGFFKDLKEIKKTYEFYKNSSYLEEIEREIYAYEEETKRVTEDLKRLKEELKGLLSHLDLEKGNLKRFLEDSERELEELKERRAKIEAQRIFLVESLGKERERLKILETQRNRYLEIKEQREALEGDYSYLERLQKLLSGGRKGISFHSFVISKFLHLILKRANHYLKEFTCERYRFREEEVFTKEFKLSVFDSYTGYEREVNTLSGGESFLASLSFALGAGDVLLSFSKKVPIETLLIDEGFGSLDENTLEQVIQALIQLSQKTGKIIGIISHVSDLRERFPIVLEVIKNLEKGSQIKIFKNL